MPLTLTILNAGALDNGAPRSLVLDRRGALIGRAATNDWCLPDPSLHISSRHCEVRFVQERYELHDISTNGTFLRGHSARLPGPHVIVPGDVFTIGQFEISAQLDEAAAAQAAAALAAPPTPEWKGWSANGDAAPPISESAWDRRPAGAAITGSGAMSQAWAPPPSSPAASGGWGAPAPSLAPSPDSSWGAPAAPPVSEPSAASSWGAPPVPEAPPSATPPASSWGAPAGMAEPASSSGWGAPPVSPVPSSSGWGAPPAPPAVAEPPSPSTWDIAPAAPVQGASAWSSPSSPPPPPGADDIWGKFQASNVVDWARGGFGKPTQPVAAPMPAATSGHSAWGAPSDPPVTTTEPVSPAPVINVPAAAPMAQPAPSTASLAEFAQALGVPQDKLQLGDAGTIGMAGQLLRRLIAGLVVMLEARARAKSQLGAQGTSLEFAGNNPLKFARTPEQALAQLLNDPQRGFMGSEQAIEDAFKDLQAHQMATLAAMQGALRATLDRFSPTAIRKRAETGGFLSKVLPGAKDAALWKAYEREFSGVAQGSDEAFMDVFAKEFRRAYEEAAKR